VRREGEGRWGEEGGEGRGEKEEKKGSERKPM